MNILARLFLMLALAATSLGLGAARGQLRLGGEIVLCAGGAVTVVQAGPDGTPVEHTQVCPDMAPLMLAGLDVPAADVPARAPGRAGPVIPAAQAQGVPRPVTIRHARGPPSAAVA